MAKTIDTITLMQMNNYLKEKEIDCTLHLYGACTNDSLQVKNNSSYPIEKICLLLNEYLKDKWLKLEIDPYHKDRLLSL